MKKSKNFYLLLIILGSFLFSSHAFALDWKGGVDFMYGKKDLDSDWKPVDSWNEFGVMLSFTEADLPFGLTAGYLTGDDDNLSISGQQGINLTGINTSAKTEEFLLGIRKDFAPAGSEYFRAYVNGGYTGIKWSHDTTTTENGAVTSSAEVDDWAHGFWMGGGVYFLFSENAAIGLDYKYTNASSDINTAFGKRTLEVGGSHYSAFVGWRF